MRRWIFVIIIALGAWHFWSTREIHHEPGVLVDGTPEQSAVGTGHGGLVKAGYRITPLQTFSLAV